MEVSSLEAAPGRSVMLMPLNLANLRAVGPLVTLVSVAVVAALAALAGCGGGGGEAAGAPNGGSGPNAARPAVPVGIEPAVVGRASSYYTATATLEARAEALRTRAAELQGPVVDPERRDRLLPGGAAGPESL